MITPSQWTHTKTFFPLLLSELEKCSQPGSACVVGAADGKFVIPLAVRGWKVTAIDVDEVALFGGSVEFPRGNFTTQQGLQERLKEAGLGGHVAIKFKDLYDFHPRRKFDTIFTSCSWHYSRNHGRPLSEYIGKMQGCLKKGGIFCAEYMMPVEQKHFCSEHYLYQGQIRQYFAEWEVIEEFYTAPFLERAHVGNLTDHVHQMGFFMARKGAPLA